MTAAVKMFETLNRRCQEIEAKKAELAPQAVADLLSKPEKSEKPEKLKWKKISEHCIESVCGRFQILKRVLGGAVDGEPTRTRYFCYQKCPEWFWHFETAASGDLARKACETARDER